MSGGSKVGAVLAAEWERATGALSAITIVLLHYWKVSARARSRLQDQ